jgi:two-component system, sensor histidine kinase YesM
MEEDMVPLLKEINYIKAYLLLQKERFGDQLEYSIHVDDEVLHVHVPKMILQPIIENYFKHGFESRDRVGKIEIECKKDGKFLAIKILDNGSGVSEVRLKEIDQFLNEENSSPYSSDSNIGLKNVHSRLRLNYDQQATFELHNQENGGFLVFIRLPITVEEGKNESNHY